MAPEELTAAALERRLAGLLPIGRSSNGGTTRLAWSDEYRATAAWFRDQAASVGLASECDPAGNLWAVPDSPPPWWAIGSHLDSVVHGGAYDGALGVAAGFEVAAHASKPICVISFADEEGARFNTPTFGSRALAGALDPAVLERTDADDVRLADAMDAAGVPARRVRETAGWIERLRGLIEIHCDQTSELERAGRPYGIVAGLAARMRMRAELVGRADHAGTTHGPERRDALGAAARLIVAAEDLAAAAGAVCTATRIEVEPNALTTVPETVRMWIDLRAAAHADVSTVREQLEVAAVGLEQATGVRMELHTESEAPGGELDPGLRRRLGELSQARGEDAPELLCYAGHDAGVLASRRPTAMLLVRNAAGISHAPAETVDLPDAARASRLALDLLEQIA